MAHKIIVSQEYPNGRFGNNTAWIAREAPTKYSIGGYLVSDGSYDPFFYVSPVIAKQQYRKLLQRVVG